MILGAKSTDSAVLSVLAGEIAQSSGYVPPGPTATSNVALPTTNGAGVGATDVGLSAVVAGVVVGLIIL